MDKEFVPLNFVLPKAKTPSPAEEISPKSGETSSFAGESEFLVREIYYVGVFFFRATPIYVHLLGCVHDN